MKVFLHFVTGVVTAMLVANCGRVPAIVYINDPCNTFVSEFAPNHTPFLKKTDKGQLTLEISFTPAENSEANEIISALKQHPIKLRIVKSDREIQTLRLGSGSVLVSVSSKEEAEAVLEDLCFKKTDLVTAKN